MGTTLRPTKHALDRFRQRVLPLLPTDLHSKFCHYGMVAKLLRSTKINPDDFSETHNDSIKVNAFLSIDGLPYLPLTFIINPIRSIIITLYIQSGWDVENKSGTITWRWMA